MSGSRRYDSAAELIRRACAAAESSASLVDPSDGRSGRPAEVGDLFLLPQIPDSPLEWAVVTRHPDRPGLLLTVPADTNPSRGSADLAVPAGRLSGPLSLRCGFGVWIDERFLRPDLRTGVLDREDVDRARRLLRLDEVPSFGTIAVEAATEDDETMGDPELEDWLIDVVAPACAAVKEALRGAPRLPSAAESRPSTAPQGRPTAVPELAVEAFLSKLEPLDPRAPEKQLERMFGLARELLIKDPQGGLFACSLTVAVAEGLGEGDAPAPAQDLRARAWAELGNARRIHDDFRGADEAFREANERFAQGTRDAGLLARILDLMASLRRAERRFDEAIQLLDIAADLHRRRGDLHLCGSSLVNWGATLLAATEYEAAARVTAESLSWIDPANGLVMLSALHNLINSLIQLGRYQPARGLLDSARPLYDEHAGPTLRLRARWLEGMIAAGLGEHLPAARAFEEARAGFDDLGFPYETALVSLELAALWLGRGQLGEIETLLQEVLLTFRALEIPREAATAVLMLYEAARQRQLTLDLVRQTIQRLRDLQQAPPADPGL